MDTLKSRLKKAEDLRLKPYQDTTGYLTIGYGRCLDKVGISTNEAELMLEADLYHASDAYLSLPLEKVRNLNVNRRRVIVEMIFNIGSSGVLGFKRMWKAIAAGDFNLASDEMLDSKWARQVKGRAVRMAHEMRNG